MALGTYAELIAAIKDYTLRQDAPFDTFVRLAESDFGSLIKHYRAVKTVTTPIVDGVVALPADFLEARTIKIDGQVAKPLGNAGGSLEASEIGYRHIGGEFRVVADIPVEDAEITYWSRVPSLTATAPTNWLLTYFPAVYLHSVLARFYRWVKDDQAEALEKQSFAEALAMLDADEKRASKIANPIVFGGARW